MEPRPDPPAAQPVPATPLPCIFCGYDLSQSPREGLCPECGRPANDSYVDSRPGTRWQNERTFEAWLATVRDIWSGPQLWSDQVRYDLKTTSWRHTFRAAIYAGLLPLSKFSLIATHWYYWGHSTAQDVLRSVAVAPVIALLAMVVCRSMCGFMLRTWCESRGQSLPRAVFGSIDAHATMMICVLLGVAGAVVCGVQVICMAMLNLDSGSLAADPWVAYLICVVVSALGVVFAIVAYIGAMCVGCRAYLRSVCHTAPAVSASPHA